MARAVASASAAAAAAVAATATLLVLLLAAPASVTVQPAHAFMPATNPPWPSTYNMSLSTITMLCNSSGWLFDEQLASSFGIASIDWSNAKRQWANQQPMDCEARLLEQAIKLKDANPASNVFVYRNLVKALPWFTSVREKLDDPAYAGFFLKFKPGGAFPNGTYHVPNCDTNYSPPRCSLFYHDQEQTPGDGSCTEPCDCGVHPCGEYLWDHRNGTMLREFLLNEHIGGPTGVDSPDVSGLFIDDFWCAHLINGTSACHDPVQGPSEINQYSQADMGLTDQDIADITTGWLETMTAAQEYIVARKKWTWSLAPGQDNANASPVTVSQASCTETLRQSCGLAVAGSDAAPPPAATTATSNPYETMPLLFGLTPGSAKTGWLPDVQQDIAAFLLMRGPYAYAGWGVWGMSWPLGMTWDNSSAHHTVPRPPELGADYGEPTGACVETATGSQVFTREYSKASVKLSCADWKSTITFKS